MSIPYLILLVAETPPRPEILKARTQDARNRGRVVVAVGPPDNLSWDMFVAALGGAVPNWRALTEDYPKIAVTAAANDVPAGLQGEAWEIFEDAIADGFEFMLGNRVRRLGNRKRGRRVGDLVTQTPDNAVLVVDTKSSAKPFHVGFPDLRALVEYVTVQHVRQTGSIPVGSAVIVAKDFKQSKLRLHKLSSEFLVETRVPATFLKVDAFLDMIDSLRRAPTMRNKIRWRGLLCGGGLVDADSVRRELTRVAEESV